MHQKAMVGWLLFSCTQCLGAGYLVIVFILGLGLWIETYQELTCSAGGQAGRQRAEEQREVLFSPASQLPSSQPLFKCGGYWQFGRLES